MTVSLRGDRQMRAASCLVAAPAASWSRWRQSAAYVGRVAPDFLPMPPTCVEV